jgi:hypothetical protein
MKGNSNVPVAEYGRVAVVWLEGCIEMVDRLTGAVFRASYQAEVRTLVQPSGKEPVTVRRALQSQKHTQGGASSRGQQHLRQAALRTQQHETQPMKKEVWMLLKLEGVLTPA